MFFCFECEFFGKDKIINTLGNLKFTFDMTIDFICICTHTHTL